jgi:epoxyqueuosine reductase QueG
MKINKNNKKDNYRELKDFCLSQGAELFGVADISKIRKDFLLPRGVFNKFRFAVSLGIRLNKAIFIELDDQPTRMYYHHYRTVNTILDNLAYKTACFLEDKGSLSLAIPASQVLDWQKQTAHLPHKKIAVLAGLGWIGRNNLLVNERFGSRLRLVTVLTDMSLVVDKPKKNNCGTCYACVKACPAHAIKATPQEFEHLKCFAKLKEFQKKRICEQFICGVCVKACSGNR